MLSVTRIVWFPKARPYFLLAQRSIIQVAVHWKINGPFTSREFGTTCCLFVRGLSIMHDSNRKHWFQFRVERTYKIMIGRFLNNRVIINPSSLSDKGTFSSGKAVGRSSAITNLIPDETSKLVIQKMVSLLFFETRWKAEFMILAARNGIYFRIASTP